VRDDDDSNYDARTKRPDDGSLVMVQFWVPAPSVPTTTRSFRVYSKVRKRLMPHFHFQPRREAASEEEERK